MGMNGIQVVHFIPGRVRLKARLIRGNPSLAAKITDLLLEVQGIQAVEANPVTGSLLIAYGAVAWQSPNALQILGEALRILAPQFDQEKWLELSEWL